MESADQLVILFFEKQLQNSIGIEKTAVISHAFKKRMIRVNIYAFRLDLGQEEVLSFSKAFRDHLSKRQCKNWIIFIKLQLFCQLVIITVQWNFRLRGWELLEMMLMLGRGSFHFNII